MKRQVNGGRSGRDPGSGQAAPSGSTRSRDPNEVDHPAPTLPKKSFLALAGAVVLLGCQVDPGGTAPGGLEPSASSQRSEDRDDTGPGGGSPPGGGSEDGESGDSSPDGGGSGSGGSGGAG